MSFKSFARAPRISFQVFRTCNVGNCLNAFLCSHGSCSKSFWDLPLVEGPARHVHPKTTTFCLVLGFTPYRQPSKAHQSQNNLEQLYSAPSLALPGILCGTFRPVSPSRFSGLIYSLVSLVYELRSLTLHAVSVWKQRQNLRTFGQTLIIPNNSYLCVPILSNVYKPQLQHYGIEKYDGGEFSAFLCR